MADKGAALLSEDLYDPKFAADRIPVSIHVPKGAAVVRDFALPLLPPMLDYSLAGTLQPDAGNPPPTRGQIWPRGNITKN